MKVREVMNHDVMVCSMDMDLSKAGEIMAAAGCGILPVVDGDRKVIGVVTDRDICLALATANRKASEMTVREVSDHKVFSCHQGNDIRDALRMMADYRVRRLPVVDDEGRLEGILCLDDIALRAQAFESEGFTGPFFSDVATTLRAVCEPQNPLAVS